MADYNYSQGQTAPFYGLFVLTPSGQSTSVPDATITIFGQSGQALPPTPMVQAGTTTGLYTYNWVIPTTLPVDTYTVLITGTVQSVATAVIHTINVSPAGSNSFVAVNQMTTDLIAALSVYLECAQNVPVYRELTSRSSDLQHFNLTWGNWNLTNVDVRMNNRQISMSDPMFPYSLDFNSGTLRFSAPLIPEDRIEVSYNFRMFTDNELIRFLADAISEINVTAPFSHYTVTQFPLELIGPVMMGARKNAMLKLMMCLQFQNTQTIFGGREAAKDAYNAFKDIKENSEKSFSELRIQIKKKLPKIAMISTPEYTLPGGRARWFRYLFSSGTG